MFLPGDIVAVRGKPHEIVLNGLIEPQTHRWHHLLIADDIDNDYEIYESLGDGVNCGRLSFYKGADVVVYRVPYRRIAHRAMQEVSCFGRSNYDYILFIKLLAQANWYWMNNGWKPVPYTWFKSSANQSLICTELVAMCYERANYPLVLSGIVPTPAAIKQAYTDNKTQIIFEGIL